MEINLKYSYKDFSSKVVMRNRGAVINNLEALQVQFKPMEYEHAMIEVLHNPLYENLPQEVRDQLSPEDVNVLSDNTNDGMTRKIISNTLNMLTLDSDLPVPLRYGTLETIYKGKKYTVFIYDRIKIYWDVKQVPVDELNNSIIRGSCFAQEADEKTVNPMVDIFAPGLTGVIFQRVNMDNGICPPGNTLEAYGGLPSTNRKIKKQNDLMDWVLSELNSPIEPVDKKLFLKLGLSIDPADIPTSKLEISVVEVKRKELADGGG